MKKNPNAVEILKPSGNGVTVYEGKIRVYSEYVIVHLENQVLHFPKHRVHRIVHGDEDR